MKFSGVTSPFRAVWSASRRFLRSILPGKAAPRAPVEHVFVLMLENRSFDHMLGFAALQGTDAVNQQPTQCDGLVDKAEFNVDPESPGVRIYAAAGAPFKISKPDPGPGHEFDDVLTQLCWLGAVYQPGKYPPINNCGFVASYGVSGASDPGNIMKCFAPEQVPVLVKLAREFAVCDQWFSSMPGPTWPNRFFIHAASSAGLDDSPSGFQSAWSELGEGFRFENGTVFDRLDQEKLEWTIFHDDDLPQSLSIKGMTEKLLDRRFREFETFSKSVNDPDFSSSYIFIEPNYGHDLMPGDYTCGNSQHPLDDVTRGERLIKKVYETIRNSPLWERSLLLIVYDEHGGFFDHVNPPGAPAPGDKIEGSHNSHNGFDFTQYGVRVPAVVVSPRIPRGTIDHRKYDHASLLATVERIFDLEPLTNRDRGAANFLDLLSLSTPRTDAPTSLPEPPDSGFHCHGDPGFEAPAAALAVPVTPEPLDDARIDPSLQGFLHIAFLRRLHHVQDASDEELKEAFLKIKNMGDARRYMREVRTKLREKKGKPE